MGPGCVVEYFQGKELALAFCLTAENKGKFQVLTPNGKKESLATKKVLFVHSTALSGSATREEILSHLQGSLSERERASSELDLEELWELLQEEDEKDWQLDELCDFLFSGEIGEKEKATLFHALLEKKSHFSRKGDAFRLRSSEQVQEALTRAQVEARREVERAAVKEWMRAVWDRKSIEVAAEFESIIAAWKKRIRDAAIQGEKSSHFQHVQRYLKELDNKTREPAFHFMVRTGEWSPDENLDLHINETPLEFSEEVLAEAKLAEQLLAEVLEQEDREDFSQWDCYAIDDPGTTEVDDALGYEKTESGFRLAIHIADASALVRPQQEVLEKEVRERSTTVYLPDLKVRMLPQNLSDEALSLKQGELRAAFSFLIDLDSEGKVLERRLTPSKVCVKQRLEYDDVDALVESGDDYWSGFAEIGEKLKAARESKGAINLPFPRVDVRLEGKNIHLVPDERDSRAQTIVSEMMILANRVAADYLAENGLPAIYRSQKPPDPPFDMRESWPPHVLYEVRRSFSRSAQSLEPSPHSGLGLDQYVQATSPIRRYRDLLHQRQIKHHLRTGEALYSNEQMEESLTFTSTPVSQAEKMERNRKSYYVHKLLKSQRGQEVEAIVLNCTPERYVIQLRPTLREVEVPHGSAPLKSPGEQVKVKILSAYPRDRVVKVSPPVK